MPLMTVSFCILCSVQLEKQLLQEKLDAAVGRYRALSHIISTNDNNPLLYCYGVSRYQMQQGLPGFKMVSSQLNAHKESEIWLDKSSV